MENRTYQIAIQGYRGAFHDIAAQKYVGRIPFEIIESIDFEGVLSHVKKGPDNHLGMMAIENTLFGSLMNNYQLLSNSNVWIEGEIYLRIKQNLMAKPGQTIEELDAVYSHPIAIAQCRDFFENYPHIKLIETDDTAGSARMIQEQNLIGKGAIASELAAKIYGLEIVNKSIESNKLNYTRFLALSPQESNQRSKTVFLNKASVRFTVDHRVGSLYKVLGGFAEVGLNLSKIQSTPIIGHPWEYQFFADFVMTKPEQIVEAKKVMDKNCRSFKILGLYPKGKRYAH